MKNQGPNKKSKLLCGRCKEVNQVTSVENDIAILACGHSRTCGLLPVELGHISVEHMLTTIGRKLFPAQRDNEPTSRLSFDEKSYFGE
jgi:hypothetical protein